MKWYLSNLPTPVGTVPFLSSMWDDAATIKRALSITRGGSNTASSRAEVSPSDSWDVGLWQGVSPPMLRGGTLQGPMSLTMAVRESSLAANLATAVAVYVVAGDTGVVRGIGVGGNYTLEWPTTFTGRTSTATLAEVSGCQPGDRLVVEVGYRSLNTVTTSYTGTMRYGGTATTDLATSNTGTNATTRSPHITLSDPAVDLLWTEPAIRPSNHFHVLA